MQIMMHITSVESCGITTAELRHTSNFDVVPWLETLENKQIEMIADR